MKVPAPTTQLRLLILNTDLPVFPGGGGVEHLTMTSLARQGHDVAIVSMAHTRAQLDGSASLETAGVRRFLWLSPWLDAPATSTPAPTSMLRRVHARLRDAIIRARLPGGRPADTTAAAGAFSNMAAALTEALSAQRWDALAVVQTSSAAMFDDVPRPALSVLVMHDIRARLYERRAAVARSPIERLRLRRQARLYADFERRYCAAADLVVTVSAEDAGWVARHYAPRRVHVLPLPVDADHFSPASGAGVDGRIVFTGLMNHPPNSDAANYFAREVLPGIRARIPAAHFHIVGRSPTPEVRALAALPGVEVHADVPDIRDHIASASVIVAPLRFGSGSRQKILEAWAMEKCVVATPIGAEGLDYQPGESILIGDNTSALVGTITTALGDPALRDRVRRRGREVVRKQHDPETLAAGYAAALTAARAARRRARPMRILIDLRWMVPGVAGGIEHLARAFLRELTGVDRSNHYTVLVPAATGHELGLARHPNFRVVSLDSAPALVGRVAEGVTRRVLARLRVPDFDNAEVRHLRWLRNLDIDLVYSFTGYIHPSLHPLRHVLLMPDIQHEYFPEFFSAAALAERRKLYSESAHRADHICAISEFTRQTLIDTLGVDGARVTTIPLAADADFSPVVDNDDDVLRRHGLERGNYLFFPAHTWLHKNHRAAVDALRLLRDRGAPVTTLVCSGGAREAQPALAAQIAAASLGDRVRFLGYVPRGDLPALYRQAALLLYPSLFEGFGIPVLEAMASGCPVVCSNTTSLPEIAGDAARLVSPDDPEAIAGAVAAICRQPEERAALVARGLRRAPSFSWRRHTLETLAVLRQVYETL